MRIAPPQELPEIKRLDLAEVVLTLKAAGVEDLRKFRWLEKPDEISLTHAEELLADLGAEPCGVMTADDDAKRTALKSPRLAARCWPFRCTRVTRGCCWRRRNTAASIRPASSRR